MKKKMRLFGAKYITPILLILCILSIIFASFVLSKYTVEKSLPGFDLNITSRAEIGLSLHAGATAERDWEARALYITPGTDLLMNPYARISENSAPCYLFIKVENSQNFPSHALPYSFADGWTQGDGTNIPANVYYREVSTAGEAQFFQIVSGDKISVPDTVTEETLSEITASPTLTLTAYALQKTLLQDANRDNNTAAGAWEWIGKSEGGTLPADAIQYVFETNGNVSDEFIPSEVLCEVSGEKCIYTVTNKSNIPAYIRVAAICHATDENGNILAQTPEITVTVDGWGESINGYYYYANEVAPGGATNPITITVTNLPDGYIGEAFILAEAIQSNPSDVVETVWGWAPSAS